MRIGILAAATLLAMATQASANETMYVGGGANCYEFNQNFNNSRFRSNVTEWLYGFFSGLNDQRLSVEIDLHTSEEDDPIDHEITIRDVGALDVDAALQKIKLHCEDSDSDGYILSVVGEIFNSLPKLPD